MKRNFPALPAVVLSLLVLSACANSNTLVLPGEVARPPLSGPSPAGPPMVAVPDFTYAPASGEPDVIGRDYDQVRRIVWKGDPGRTMADLVAGAFAGRDVAASRVKAGEPASGDARTLVSGIVRRFELNIRRRNVFTLVTEATVSLSLAVSGQGVPIPWETTVTITEESQDVYPFPEYYTKVLSSAANAAAAEGVKRIQERGVAGPTR